MLSIVRLHKVQAMMNLRQALEAGCAGAVAIANLEDEHFFRLDKKGLVKSPQRLTDKRYRWRVSFHSGSRDMSILGRHLNFQLGFLAS